jgi:beta-glucosidase
MRVGVLLGMQDAAQRKMEFMLGAFADPIFKGDFPASVKQRISFLPQITPQLVVPCS